MESFDPRFTPKPLSPVHAAVLSALLADPCASPLEIASKLALDSTWVAQVLASDLLQAHARRLARTLPTVSD